MSLFQETPLWFVIIVQLYVSMTTGNTIIDAHNRQQLWDIITFEMILDDLILSPFNI